MLPGKRFEPLFRGWTGLHLPWFGGAALALQSSLCSFQKRFYARVVQA